MVPGIGFNWNSGFLNLGFAHWKYTYKVTFTIIYLFMFNETNWYSIPSDTFHESCMYSSISMLPMLEVSACNFVCGLVSSEVTPTSRIVIWWWSDFNIYFCVTHHLSITVLHCLRLFSLSSCCTQNKTPFSLDVYMFSENFRIDLFLLSVHPSA